MTEVITLT